MTFIHHHNDWFVDSLRPSRSLFKSKTPRLKEKSLSENVSDLFGAVGNVAKKAGDGIEDAIEDAKESGSKLLAKASVDLGKEYARTRRRTPFRELDRSSKDAAVAGMNKTLKGKNLLAFCNRLRGVPKSQYPANFAFYFGKLEGEVDAAYTVHVLQKTLGVKPDGKFGESSMRALRKLGRAQARANKLNKIGDHAPNMPGEIKSGLKKLAKNIRDYAYGVAGSFNLLANVPTYFGPGEKGLSLAKKKLKGAKVRPGKKQALIEILGYMKNLFDLKDQAGRIFKGAEEPTQEQVNAFSGNLNGLSRSFNAYQSSPMDETGEIEEIEPSPEDKEKLDAMQKRLDNMKKRMGQLREKALVFAKKMEKNLPEELDGEAGNYRDTYNRLMQWIEKGQIKRIDAIYIFAVRTLNQDIIEPLDKDLNATKSFYGPISVHYGEKQGEAMTVGEKEDWIAHLETRIGDAKGTFDDLESQRALGQTGRAGEIARERFRDIEWKGEDAREVNSGNVNERLKDIENRAGNLQSSIDSFAVEVGKDFFNSDRLMDYEDDYYEDVADELNAQYASGDMFEEDNLTLKALKILKEDIDDLLDEIDTFDLEISQNNDDLNFQLAMLEGELSEKLALLRRLKKGHNDNNMTQAMAVIGKRKQENNEG